MRPSLRKGRWLILFPFCFVLFFVGLNSGVLYRNESLRALVAVEALRAGSWLVPTLHGEPQLTKPPGMAVAIALTSLPWGDVTVASARLPSALCACLTVGLFYWTFARLLGARAGLVAGLLLPVSVLWLDRVPSAEIDLVQLAWVTASLLLLLRATEASEEGRPWAVRWLWWQGALLCAAGGCLTKWTGPAFFYLTAVPFLAWRRNLRLLFSGPHLLAALLGGLLCLAWLACAARAAGAREVIDTVSREALQRLSPGHHPRPYPWDELVTFPLGFLLGCLPGAAAAAFALRRDFIGLWDQRTQRLVQLLHAWVWPGLLFWALAPGHRPRHTLPLQPALAGLAALVWFAWLEGRLRWPMRFRPGHALAALVLLWVAVKLSFSLGVLAPSRERGREEWEAGRRLAALVPAGETIYLSRLKDEGIFFSAGHPTRRVPVPANVPAGRVALLTEPEWDLGREGFSEVGRLALEQNRGEHSVLVLARRKP